MNAIAKQENASVVTMSDDSLLAIISRAAADPATDVDKLERLLAMAERVRAQDAKAAYITALSEIQNELPVIVERGKTDKSKYALWEDINDAIKPILQKHGFALSFRTGQTEGKIIITGVLSHKDGHSEETAAYLPSDTSGSKNAVQAVGSSISYGKRYTTIALLNITSRGEDDDAGAAGGDMPITQEQADNICERLAACGADIEAYCKYVGVAAVKDIRAKKLKDAIAAVAKKEKAKAK